MPRSHRIPFTRPLILPEFEPALSNVIRSGHWSGRGPATSRVEKRFTQILGRPNLLVTSATHALEMMAFLLDIKPGDEVIVPSFTFVSTANAFAIRGARVIFGDVDAFGNLDPKEVARLLSPRTRAVIAVDYGGHSADLDLLQELCDQNGTALFQDSAQSIGASYKSKPLGTTTGLSCFSFHETKNIGCGEGGLLIFGEKAHPNWLARAEILREKGTNRSKFLQGLVDKYTWVDLGSSYVLSELNAALLEVQIPLIPSVSQRRGVIWKRYADELSGPLSTAGATFLEAPSYNTPNYHLFGILLPSLTARSTFIGMMSEHGISTPFHYQALHLSEFAQRHWPDRKARLPVSEKFSDCLVRLPLFADLSERDQGRVIEVAIKALQTIA